MRSGKQASRVALLCVLAAWGSLAAGLAGAAQSAPATAPTGTALDLSEWKGKVVYLDFWASWCVPCRQSFPWMNTLHHRYGKDGLVVVAVNMDQDRAAADAFLRQYPADFTVRFDPRGQLAQGFKLRGMPTSALLDRDGKVLLVHEGFRGKDAMALEDSIRTALH